MTGAAAGRTGGGRRRAVAWALLDWAASSFSTVQITLLVAYCQRIVFADRAWGVEAGVVWAWTLAAAMLVVALIVPWLAAWADRTRRHRTALVGSTIGGAAALVMLAAAPPTARSAVVAGVVVAAVCFDLAAIFTGSLLPTIATGPDADRLSARGYAAGYAGGALALVAATTLAMAHDRLGITPAGGLQAAFLLTGAWWVAFSLPAAFTRFEEAADDEAASSSGRELLAFARSLAGGRDGERRLAVVLAGAVLVLGAVQTAIAQFSSVALAEFGLDGPGLVRLVLFVQVVALPGALAVGRLSARAGRQAGIAACVAGWALVLALAWFVRTVPQLYGLAALLALVLGGIQSVIRSTVAGLAPDGRTAATFGLLQVGTKLAGCVASLVFGGIYALAGSPRTALVSLLVQLLAGWWILRSVGDPAAAERSAA